MLRMDGKESLSVPEKRVNHAVNLLDRLYHGQIELVLKPDAFEDFKTSVFLQAANYDDERPQHFFLQFFISETPEELVTPESIHWFAIRYEMSIRGDDLELAAEFVLTPNDDEQDLHSIEKFQDTPFHVIQWSDVAWQSFNPDEPVHA